MPYDLLQCNKVLCEIKGHVNCICKLHDDIISACLDASEIIPETGKKIKQDTSLGCKTKP